MENKTNKKMGASAPYRGWTLTLAKGAKQPVILVINRTATRRQDGVVEIVATPAMAKAAVDRRIVEPACATPNPTQPRKDGQMSLATELQRAMMSRR